MGCLRHVVRWLLAPTFAPLAVILAGFAPSPRSAKFFPLEMLFPEV